MSLLSISRRKNPIPPNPSLLIITRHSTISNSSEQQEQSTKNRAYWTKQIHNLCSKQGRVDEALGLLDRLCLEQAYIPNWLNLNSIIHALCDANRFAEAHRRLLLAISSNCAFDERSCNVLIARLLGAKDPSLTLRVLHGFLIANPEFVPTLMNYNRLIDQLCSSAGLPVEAYRLLIDMRRRRRCPDEVSYTSLMKGFCGIGDMRSAWKVFDEMRESGVAANSMTYSVLLRGVLRGRGGGDWRELMEKVWEAMIDRREAGVNNAAFANVVDSLCKEGYFHEVFRIAEEMPQGNGGVVVDEEFAYAQMMDSLCRAGRNHGASRIVYVMRKRGLVPSAVSYNAIIHGLSKEGGCMRAYQLYQQGTEWGHSLSESTYKVLVEGLCREFDVGKAKDVLQHMLSKEGMDKTRIYNIFLRALCFVENPSELLNVLVTMLQTQCQPDVVTLNTVITGFCKVGRVDEAWSVFTDMLNGNLSSPDAVTFTTIICGLLNSCKVDEALNLLRKKMPEKGIKPSVVTYNGVLRGLFKLQKVDDAMRIFDEMMLQGVGVVADSTTYTIVIEGLCGSNRIDEAKRFWDNVVWPSKVHDNFVYAAILKGLCGSGKSNEACDFLYELVDSGITPNIVNYNILIDHYCKLGLKKEAYQIVGEMKKNGLVPDAVTWRILDKLHATARKRLHNRDSKMRSQFLKEECRTQDGMPDVRTRSKTGFSALTLEHSFPR